MYSCGDSYVVRIYRREETDSRKVVGVVEMIEDNQQQGFSNLDELCSILGAGKGGKKRGKTVGNRN